MSPAERETREARERGIMGRLALAHDEPGPNKERTIGELVGEVARAVLDRSTSSVLAERWAQVAIHAAWRVFFLGGHLEAIRVERGRQRDTWGDAPRFPDLQLVVLQEEVGEAQAAKAVNHAAMRHEWVQVAAVAVCGYVDATASPLPPSYVLVDALARGLDGDANAVGRLLGRSLEEARRICARVAS